MEDTTQPQFLRIKRRRGAVAAPSLRLGLDTTQHHASSVFAAMAAIGLEDGSSHSFAAPPPPPHQQTQQVIFRRVSRNSEADGSNNNIVDKKRRVLDAVLLEEEEDDEHPPNQPNLKRRKLQLLPTTAPTVPTEYPVLTPEQCRVDESLQAVFQRTKSLQEHLQEFSLQQPQQQFTWVNKEAGNWLHAAAVWNEVEIVRSQLQQLEDLSPAMIQQLVTARDAQGHTPFQVAEMTGHRAVAEILDAYADDADYEYDLYCWEPSAATNGAPTNNNGNQQQQQQETNNNKNGERSTAILDCELHDRCTGYFDARGELVLEAVGDERTTGPFFAVDDDQDSNSEDWEGNDYPDEDDGDDWSSSSMASQDFRQRRVTMDSVDGEYDDEEAYDAAYGGVYGQDDIEYDDEC